MNEPPKWMLRFLRWFCREDLVDAVEGDLFELFQRRTQKFGRRRAKIFYFFNVLFFLQPFAFKRNKSNRKLNSFDMFRNYFRIARRSLLKSKSTSIINIVGLAIGISSFIMMIGYVVNELSYDKFNSKADRIYRLTYSYEARGNEKTIARISFPLKYYILENYPEVEKVVRFYANRMDATTLKYEDKLFTEGKVVFADPEVFEVFDFEFLMGSPETALVTTNSIVLTDKSAKKYFGNENPIGKTLLYKNGSTLEVTAVVRDIENFHIDIDFLVPVELQRQRWMGQASNNGYDLEKDWKWSGAWTYVLLTDPSLHDQFADRFNEDGKTLFGRVDEPTVEYTHLTQPLLDIHLKSDLVSEIGVNGNINQVYGFAIIAFLILIIACLNFINLTTAHSTNRAKEIGLRKVMGAHKKHLVYQFILESILVTFIGTLLGLVFLQLMLPLFNSFMGTQLTIPFWQVPLIMLFIFIGSIVIGILAGAYPSFYLSQLKPVKTLKGNYNSDRGGSGVRRIFVVTQFVISNILIIGILVVQLQIEFIKGKDLGFDKDQIIVLEHGSKIDDDFQLFKTELDKIAEVENTTLGYVAGTSDWVQSFRIDGERREEGKSLGFKNIGYDFLEMFDLKIVSGRNFSREIQSDSGSAILINEAAARAFGWSNEEALGHEFSWIGGSDNRTRYVTKVVGVMKDANFESLYERVHPSVFKLNFFGDVAIRFNSKTNEGLITAIDKVEAAWDEVASEWPFEFKFLDQQIELQYQKDQRLGQMIQFFALLAIFIACMGLFGLATFTVKKKTKEIGVRKVLGADVHNIVFVIMRGFLVLIVLSLVISVPVGYYLSNNWLQNFAYRIELHPLIFVGAGLVSMLIASIAIVGQSLNAAKLDPVITLKYE